MQQGTLMGGLESILYGQIQVFPFKKDEIAFRIIFNAGENGFKG